MHGRPAKRSRRFGAWPARISIRGSSKRFVNLYETNVLRDLDARMALPPLASHGDIDDDLMLVA